MKRPSAAIKVQLEPPTSCLVPAPGQKIAIALAISQTRGWFPWKPIPRSGFANFGHSLWLAANGAPSKRWVSCRPAFKLDQKREVPFETSPDLQPRVPARCNAPAAERARASSAVPGRGSFFFLFLFGPVCLLPRFFVVFLGFWSHYVSHFCQQLAAMGVFAWIGGVVRSRFRGCSDRPVYNG